MYEVNSIEPHDLTHYSGTVFYALYISWGSFVSAICRLGAVTLSLRVATALNALLLFIGCLLQVLYNLLSGLYKYYNNL